MGDQPMGDRLMGGGRMRLANKVALISGGGSGIGAAAARLFAAEGAKVLVTGRRPGPIETVAAEVNGLAVAGDTSDPAHTAEAVAAAVATFGGLDVVVANAGVGFGGSVGEVDDEDWRRTLDVNLTGPMVLTRAALPAMLERGGGSIVLVSSVNGLVGTTDSAAYGTSKAGLLGLARSIAVDYGPRGIRANALCPGWVVTPMADEEMDDLGAARGIDRQAAYDLATAEVPLRRAATAHEIASCCLFLASEESSIVTGAVLVADGGGLAVALDSVAFGSEVGRSD
jgi:meso-butanediol dehydrogenase / (S,S)-butanediol dehydrogenase / diacetyl reductase